MTIQVTHRDRLAIITLNRPNRLNALDSPTRFALIEALDKAGADDDIRAVVLTGAGRAFCVGQDLGAAHELDDCYATVVKSYNPIVIAIVEMAKPVVAAVNGVAAGAGLGIVLACDVRIAAEGASFACGFNQIALVPDTAVSWFLVEELGYGRAFDLLTSGRRFSSREALEWRLLQTVVPDTDLTEEAERVASLLASGPATAIALTKRQLRATPQATLVEVLELEARNQDLAARHPDHLEGRAAFAEKRQPRWH